MFQEEWSTPFFVSNAMVLLTLAQHTAFSVSLLVFISVHLRFPMVPVVNGHPGRNALIPRRSLR